MMAAKGRIIGLSHVGLWVDDIKRSKKFYSDVLGFNIYHEFDLPSPEGTVQAALARQGDCVLEIFQRTAKARHVDGVIEHIALRVENIEAVQETLKQKGIRFDVEEGIHVRHIYRHADSKWLLFRGPDGELLEVNEIQ